MNCPDLLTKLTTLQTHARRLRNEMFKIRIQERLRTLPKEVREELQVKWNAQKDEMDRVLAAIRTAQINLKSKYEESLIQFKLSELMELLQLDFQYTSEIQMQMKQKGKVRGSIAENFEEKEMDVGWIEKRTDGTLFYKDYHWNLARIEEDKSQFEHTLPEYKESFTNWVRELGEGNIMRGIEILKKKYSQGFTHLLYRCTGVELQRLYEKIEAILIKETKPEGTGLYLPSKLPIKSVQDRGEKITELYEMKVCYFQNGYTNDHNHNEDGSGILDVDTRGDLILNPMQFDENDHGGQTFEEYLKTTGPFQWSLVIPEGNLLRSSDTTSAEAKEDTARDRKQIRTNKSPKEYLKETKFEGPFAHESWMTVHEDLFFRQSLISRFGVVLDNNTATWVPGSYIKGCGVPRLSWLATSGQLVVNLSNAGYKLDDSGARLSVKSK